MKTLTTIMCIMLLVGCSGKTDTRSLAEKERDAVQACKEIGKIAHKDQWGLWSCSGGDY